MTEDIEAAKRKVQQTYNAAADHFDAPPLAFWSRCGARTVERLGLPAGGRVLDVCCGSGASALPAARAVGTEGFVTAVDLSAGLLELARAKANATGLENIEFVQGDMTALDYPDGHFDAVVCVFGIFFVPDMTRQVAELFRMVAPGGQLAITTWGPQLFAPAYEVWLDAVRHVRPDLYSAFTPWDRITTPSAVETLLREGGVPTVDVAAEAGGQELNSPDDLWTIALGSGLRWTIDQLGDDAVAVKDELLTWAAADQVRRVEVNAIYAVGSKGE